MQTQGRRGKILSDGQGEGRLSPYHPRSRGNLKEVEVYLCYLMAELPSLGPHWLHRHGKALQAAPGMTRGINTVPKQNQMFFQTWTQKHCDPALGWADPQRHRGKPAPTLSLSKTLPFLRLTGATSPILRSFIRLCVQSIQRISTPRAAEVYSLKGPMAMTSVTWVQACVSHDVTGVGQYCFDPDP